MLEDLLQLIIPKLSYDSKTNNALFCLLHALRMVSRAWKKWLTEDRKDFVEIEHDENMYAITTAIEWDLLVEAYRYEQQLEEMR